MDETILSSEEWRRDNREYLLARASFVENHIWQYSRYLEGDRKSTFVPVPDAHSAREAEEVRKRMKAPPALDILKERFGLTDFEESILLIGVTMELSPFTFGSLCGMVQGKGELSYPTFHMAIELMPGSTYAAMTPDRPLRYWKLIQMGEEMGVTLRPLVITETVFHFLMGNPSLDMTIKGISKVISYDVPLPPSQSDMTEQMAAIWRGQERWEMPLLQLFGEDSTGKVAVAARAARRNGYKPYIMQAVYIPERVEDRLQLAHLWERELFLSNGALIVEMDPMEGRDRERIALSFLDSLRGPRYLIANDPIHLQSHSMVRFHVEKPDSMEQYELWKHSFGDQAMRLEGQLENIIAQFHLGATEIHDVGNSLRNIIRQKGNSADVAEEVWDICREQTRPGMNELAVHIKPKATLEDLILPENQKKVLQEIALHVKQRLQVYERWGFSGASTRGLGITALFSGESGTGKTMSSEVIANMLKLDLYRIDLSSIVSKYIGETEKNLRRVFDSAEGSGAILLFDEADALFGKRSDVKDSHDRYANIEVSYLLQRMEAYRGLAILTTNLKNTIDTAFMRRIRFVIDFTFPDAAHRAEIWRRVFPKSTPTKDLDMDRLGQLNVAGGTIKNIALKAAFFAAEEGSPVAMKHLHEAAKSEYQKMDRSLNSGELKGWF